MDRLPMDICRAMRARLAYLNTFVPLSANFFTRQNRHSNAILMDVAPHAYLNHFAQETIANGLANRFGGYPTDFLMSRYKERDFVVFLPEWVQSDSLIHRQMISLGELRLRCYAWNPYSGARRFSPPYKAWIRLVSLPYECCYSRTAAALVGDFDRFLQVDELTMRMVDLSGYRYSRQLPLRHPRELGACFRRHIHVDSNSTRALDLRRRRWMRQSLSYNERSDHFDPDKRSLEIERRYLGEVRGTAIDGR